MGIVEMVMPAMYTSKVPDQKCNIMVIECNNWGWGRSHEGTLLWKGYSF